MGARRMAARHARRRGALGASLVEFALIAPVFLMLVFGMFSGGIALNDKQQITHAVREGARYGATFPASEFTGNDFATTIRGAVVDRSSGLLEDADVCVAVVRGTPDASEQETANGLPSGSVKDFEVVSSTGGAACDPTETYPLPSETGDTGQRVQVSATHGAEIELGLFGSIDITIDESATAKSEYDS